MSAEGVSNRSSLTPLGPMPKDPKARLEKAAVALEGVWLTQMLREARPKSSLIGNSFASETFKDMLDQALGEKLAEAGVLKLTDSMVRQLVEINEAVKAQRAGQTSQTPQSQESAPDAADAAK